MGSLEHLVTSAANNAGLIAASGYRAMAKVLIVVIALATFSVAFAGVALAYTTIDADAQPYLVLGGFLAGAACIGLGLFLIKRGRDARRIGQDSGHWPTTDGKILTAIVAKKSYPTAGIYHVPRVRYSYAVAGKAYEGSVICPGIEQFGLGSDLQAHARVDRYPVGKTVLVHYDPNDPSVAVLEPAEVGSMRNIISGALALLLAVFFIGLAIVMSTLATT
jgi:Protein of unknown function (DUF3592)